MRHIFLSLKIPGPDLVSARLFFIYGYKLYNTQLILKKGTEIKLGSYQGNLLKCFFYSFSGQKIALECEKLILVCFNASECYKLIKCHLKSRTH